MRDGGRETLVFQLAHWLGYFERNPGERFVSDGDPDAVTVPAALRDRLRGDFLDACGSSTASAAGAAAEQAA